ncbi:MAG: hypothetical protein PHX30_05600 [Candidatus Pacebacteria bacterium]|jgi:hypothetical protein|nr:hypothetical protein [Candidatus Paceibacterota bacterium]
MKISKFWLWLSLIAGILMAGVSFLGISSESTYSKETFNWAAQAMGQDYVNLFIAFPALIISAYLAGKGSLRAYLIWLGVLFYVIYSYTLYAFFIHFGSNFLTYVAILGLAFYSLAGSLMDLEWRELLPIFSNVKSKLTGILLIIIGTIFYLLWLSDVIGALSSGTVPQGIADIGSFVNPVHVLDMAFFLPGAFLIAYLMKKRRVAGFLFAVPLMVFFAIMGLAILAIFISLSQEGIPSPLIQEIFMATIVLANLMSIHKFFKGMSEPAK